MRRRHWGLLFSFLLLVLAPLGGAAWYLWTRASDQYASHVGFTVRQEQGAGATDLLTGFAANLGGGSGSSDTDILYEFLQSQSLVGQVDEAFDLRKAFSEPYETDPVFALAPGASLAELTDYWPRILRVSYDETSRLIELRVLAFDPGMAQAIGQDVLDRSQVLINELNAQVRGDTLRYAEEDLKAAQDRLREARAELIRFRTRTQLVDPETDLEGRMGVVNTLQGQLAEALIDLDLLTEQTNNSNDARVVQARNRIDVIRKRIVEERENVARGEDGGNGTDYPTLLAEYEALAADREFAEQSYLAALAALDSARSDLSRQSRYLATYVAPTLPETAEFPQRWTLMGLIALFLVLSWSILALIYYSIRDSR
jgi:capsular polysaccharide transport system permease protein